jgi:hypothetical protein
MKAVKTLLDSVAVREPFKRGPDDYPTHPTPCRPLIGLRGWRECAGCQFILYSSQFLHTLPVTGAMQAPVTSVIKKNPRCVGGSNRAAEQDQGSAYAGPSASAFPEYTCDSLTGYKQILESIKMGKWNPPLFEMSLAPSQSSYSLSRGLEWHHSFTWSTDLEA